MRTEINLCNEVLENTIESYRAFEKVEPLNPMEEVAVKAMEELLKHKTIGTVEELTSLKENCIEPASFRLYLTLLEEYQSIGTIDEFKALKEKNEPKKPITYTHTHRADCPNCRVTVRGMDKPFGDYCSKCGIKLDWSE